MVINNNNNSYTVSLPPQVLKRILPKGFLYKTMAPTTYKRGKRYRWIVLIRADFFKKRLGRKYLIRFPLVYNMLCILFVESIYNPDFVMLQISSIA